MSPRITALPFRLPELGPIGSNGLANPRDFETPVAWFEDQRRADRGDPEDRSGALWTTTPRPFAARRRRLARQLRALSLRSVALQRDRHGQLRPSRPVDLHRADLARATCPGRANADFVIFPPRWMVAEDTFRPPWFHRNVMSEAMGLIYGAYDAKAEGFAPGGLSLHNLMSGHGPDVDSWQKASEAELKPVKIDGTMAFMVETCWPYRPTRLGARSRAARLRPGLGGLSQGEAAVTDETHDPARTSWVASAAGQRLPDPEPAARHLLGRPRAGAGPGVAIGDYHPRPRRQSPTCSTRNGASDLSQPVLNAWLARGPEAQRALRQRLSELLSDERYRDDVEPQLIGQSEVRMHVPVPDRRLHRLLRRHSSRDQCRQAVPARQSAAAELQICADRLSRPGELGARRRASR